MDVLFATLDELLKKYPLDKNVKNDVERDTSPCVLPKDRTTEWVELTAAAGKICARTCGLFPPCTPLIKMGERITAEKIELLCKADNVFGLCGNKMEVFAKE